MSRPDESRLAQLLGALSTPPVPVEDLDRRVLGDLPAMFVEESERRLRRSNAGDAIAEGFAPVTAPAELDRRIREDLHAEIVDDSERRLRHNTAGDAITEGFAPVDAPAEVDWAAAAISHAVADPTDALAADALSDQDVATPGWLWSHIRSDLLRYRLQRRRHARRTLALRAGVIAATISVTALLFHATGGGQSSSGEELDIVFVRSDRPLSASYSTSEIARRMRDGR